MRVIFMGTPDFSVGTLRALVEAGHDVCLCVTQPDKPKGRGKHMQPSPVKQAAQEYEIEVYQPRRVREDECVEYLASFGADVIVVIAFGQILPKSILDLTPYGCVNVHASLLPKYRGAAPIQWAVINGERQSGVTTMQMNEGLDTGDMLLEAVVDIDARETAVSLHDKLAKAGAKLCAETLEALERGTVCPRSQPKESPTEYAKMLKKDMGRIRWEKSAVELDRWIRGLWSWPGAYTFWNDKMLKITDAVVCADIYDAGASGTSEGEGPAPGTVIRADADGIAVQTGEGVLCIRGLQPAGKRAMDSASFLRGHALTAGECLGDPE